MITKPANTVSALLPPPDKNSDICTRGGSLEAWTLFAHP